MNYTTLYDELSITVQQTFRNHYYSLNFLLLIFPIQIYQCNLWKGKTKASSIPCSVDVILVFGFVSNIPPRDKLHLADNTSRGNVYCFFYFCVVFEGLIYILFFFQFASLIDIVMLENNPLITTAVVLREVVLQEALNKPTEQSVLYLSIIILKEIGAYVRLVDVS